MAEFLHFFKGKLTNFSLTFIALFFIGFVSAQTVITDKDDYPPGATVLITGSGFQAGEVVELHVTHADGDPVGTDPQYHAPWTVEADGLGNFTSSWYVPTEEEGDAFGATLLLTADGQTSGLHAEATFTDASSVIITSNPSATSDALTICAGTSVIFTATKTGGGCTPIYQWRKNGINIAGATSSTYTTTALTNGDVIAVFQSVGTNGCDAELSDNAITVTVVSSAPATPGAITQPTNKCAGSTGNTYSISAVSGAASYTWSVTGTGWSVTAGGSTTSATITIGSGVGTVSVTATNVCGTSAASTTGNITPTTAPTTPGAITQPTNKCVGSTDNTYSISAVSGAASYSWSVTGTGWSVTAGGSTISATITIGSGVGTVSVIATNVCGTSAASTTGNITPTTTPATPGAITQPTNKCAGSTGNTYSISAVSGAASYTWSVTGTGWSVTAGGSTTSATITIGSGVGTVSVSATNVCGTSAASTTGNITPTIVPATPGTITGLSSVCTIATGVSYSIVAVSGATSYTWTVPSGASITSGQGTTSIAVTFANTSGNVSVTASNACGTSSAQIKSVTVNPLATIFNVSFTGSLCGIATIKLDGSQNGVDYALLRNATTVETKSGTGNPIDFTPANLSSGAYTVVATNSTTGCTSTMSGIVNTSGGTPPTLYNVTGGGAYCSGGLGRVVGLDNSETGVSYQLYIGVTPAGGSLAGTGAALDFGLQTAAGTYTVVGTKTSGGCTATMTGSVVVSINTAPVITTTYSNISVNNDVGLCGANVSYATATATGTPIPSITYSQASGTVFPVGTTTVIVTATNSCGSDSKTFNITVDDTQAPTASDPADINVQCLADVPAADAAVVTDEADNCGTATVSFVSQTADPLVNDGTITRTYRVDDGNGNTFDVFQDIVIDDTQAPTASDPADINVQCLADVPAADAAVVTDEADNCGTATVSFISQTADPLVNDGTITRTYRVDDGNGNTFDVFQDIVIDDTQAPTASDPADINVQCLADVPAADAAVVTDEADNCGTATVSFISQTADPLVNDGTITRTYRVDDGNGNTFDVFQDIVIDDTQAPTWSTTIGSLNTSVSCGNTVTLLAGQALAPTATDNCGGTLTYAKTSGVLVSGPNGTYTNTWTATDANGNESGVFTQVITLTQVTIDASASSTPVQLGTDAILIAQVSPTVPGVSVTFYLSGSNATNSLQYTIMTDVNGKATQIVSNLASDVYKVIAVAGTNCDRSEAYLPVYDPNGGFVTGGGWINSPGNAMSSGAIGKANFGFNAKYKTGKNNLTEVDGNTNFQFQAGDINLKSLSHDNMSLVISGAKATYRGVGTINGTGNHKFLLIAIDGDVSGGGGFDKFRIKIWGNNSSTVIYDNQMSFDENSNDATILGGGSIVIHKPKGKEQEGTLVKTTPIIMQEMNPEILETLAASPNPLVSFSTVRFSVREDANVILRVYDYSGRMIETLYNGQVKAYQNYDVDFQRRNLMSGIYIVKLTTDKGQSYDKRIIVE